MKRICLAALFSVAFATGLVAAEPKELAAAKKEFAQNAHPDEAARVHYVQSLATLRGKLAKSGGDWQAVDAELRKHPAPSSAEYSSLRVGEWTSPRHGYVYRKNGTWSMTPVEPDATRGGWKIEGNQYFAGAMATKKADMTKYTIILLTAKDFIFTDGTVVFFEKKGK
ncbi:MAG TPA: hypothetical protein VK961_22475 [Chthoniobacter sp.]|nr:hypothetical protein [Chthoniobacter sp.]